MNGMIGIGALVIGGYAGRLMQSEPVVAPNGQKGMRVFEPSDFPEPSMISVNSIDLEVYEAGKENAGNPIVLCHGWPELAFSWRYQIPALVAAGYHVIAPNQRGYGNSSSPTEVTDYDIAHLAGDLTGLLDHFGYEKATFVGHDWGASVVWWLTLLHPERVKQIINLALPYQERGPMPWVELLEGIFGQEYYMVHFNRQPGVADAILDENTHRFLSNLFRKNLPAAPPDPAMMLNLATTDAPLGDPLMSEAELGVYVSAFEKSGFTGSINWYRNLDRNWHLLADEDPIIQQPALMIYGERDVIPKFDRLAEYVPNVDVMSLDCGHNVQLEKPVETTQAILGWLNKQAAS